MNSSHFITTGTVGHRCVHNVAYNLKLTNTGLLDSILLSPDAVTGPHARPPPKDMKVWVNEVWYFTCWAVYMPDRSMSSDLAFSILYSRISPGRTDSRAHTACW